MTIKTLLVCLTGLLLLSSAALGLINVPSDGSDGAFNPTASIEIDLSQAVTGTWSQAGNGHGVYDGDKWAVVFKYSSINIPAGVTVTFKHHPSRAPVVWLVQGNVTIAGTVNLDGQDYRLPGAARNPAESGPGGFRGGAPRVPAQMAGGPGLGPGGGYRPDGGGSYGSLGAYLSEPTYGNAGILPLLGGSGGKADAGGTFGGGAGGGAILIAARDTVTLTGQVTATGGDAENDATSGSGGGIRLVADIVVGGGGLNAAGGGGFRWGGAGRIRVEANQSDWAFGSNPALTFDLPGTDPLIWLPADKPRVKMVSLAGVAIPADPKSAVSVTAPDVYFATSGVTKTLVIQAEHVPLTWKVRARVANTNRLPATIVDATYLSGDETLSTWQADLTLGAYFTAIQVRASAD